MCIKYLLNRSNESKIPEKPFEIVKICGFAITLTRSEALQR